MGNFLKIVISIVFVTSIMFGLSQVREWQQMYYARDIIRIVCSEQYNENACLETVKNSMNINK